MVSGSVRPGLLRWGAGVAPRIALIASTAFTAAAVPARAADTAVVVRVAGSNTLELALIQSYQNNPQLNAQRSAARAVDESVAIALGGYRPRVTATGSIAEAYTETLTRPHNRSAGEVGVATLGATATQTLFNGFQTGNRTRQAEAQVFAARETLRTTEQLVLLNAVTAYMNLLRDTAILELQRSNVNVLEATLRQTRDRFNVGEVTRTDVAQAESRLAAGRSSMLTAESNVVTSRANYRQVIGVEPGRLTAAMPVDRFSPRNLAGTLARASTEHPTITTASYNVDVASFQVKIAEGALYPTVTLQGSVNKGFGSATSLTTLQTFNAQVAGQVSVPLYQGGGEYATIRQAKETLGQRRLDLDTARDQVQSTVTQAWGQLQAAKAQIESTTAQVNAAEIALNGVREEARVGQRTTLDVLNAQQDLVNARVALVTAQRDRVVASYTVLAASGALSPKILGLKIPTYDPVVHYHQIRDNWIGVRTPDGR
ncbi:MAG: outer membrane protein [Alphaproteobacteria bacterium]|jgi:outer membrane protein|nr:outer membrane protein [Alphaproteobacteria bacterium]